jgi:hypothetical protein
MREELWDLIDGTPQVDPTALAAAIERQVESGDLDYRTRLLIRDSADALESFWGKERFAEWIQRSPLGSQIQQIRTSQFDPGETRGFPTLRRRLMDATRKERITDFFKEIGSSIQKPVILQIGGSIALIFPGYLSRRTDDIDVVDEVPEEIRTQHRLLDSLKDRFGLSIAHFQSHYLPSGWQGRLHYAGTFNKVEVYLVDFYDVVLGKFFSAREKDRDDLRTLRAQIDKTELTARLLSSGQTLRADAKLAANAEFNWKYIFDEPLP